MPIEEIPITLHPYLQLMQVNDLGGSTRVGARVTAAFRFLDPLSFRIDIDVYRSNLVNQEKGTDATDAMLTSGAGLSALLGVGFDFNWFENLI